MIMILRQTICTPRFYYRWYKSKKFNTPEKKLKRDDGKKWFSSFSIIDSPSCGVK
jgi:hypothetical protein